MEFSKTKVCNLALSQLNVGIEINNLDTDAGREAMSCRNFYDVALEQILRDYRWPQFRNFEKLAKLDINPNPAWGYAYRLPSGSVFFRGIVGSDGITYNSGQNNFAGTYANATVRSIIVPYDIGRDSQGRILFTDADSPIGEFTVATDPTEWPGDFVLAFASLLAFYIAPTVTGGDQFKLGQQAYQAYGVQVKRAFANAMNEQATDVPPPSGFRRSR